MRILMIGIVLGAAIPAFMQSAVSDESSVQLKPGPGAEVVESNCGACHSLDYIPMNSPFLDEKGWSAEVTKMVKAFGAPIDEADQQQIIAYLAATYGKPPS